MTLTQFRRAASVTDALAAQWYQPLQDAMARFDINTPKRQAAFIAQVAHESGGFTCATESLYYKDPVRIAQIFKTGFDLDYNGKVDPAEVEFARGYVRNSVKLANRAYANRNGNGNESSGDGYRYRGRGPMQTTGKGNYKATGDGIGVDLVANPDLLNDPKIGALAAAWYWKTNGCNALADADKFSAITVAINGKAMLGQTDRLARWKQAKSVLLTA